MSPEPFPHYGNALFVKITPHEEFFKRKKEIFLCFRAKREEKIGFCIGENKTESSESCTKNGAFVYNS